MMLLLRHKIIQVETTTILYVTYCCTYYVGVMTVVKSAYLMFPETKLIRLNFQHAIVSMKYQ